MIFRPNYALRHSFITVRRDFSQTTKQLCEIFDYEPIFDNGGVIDQTVTK